MPEEYEETLESCRCCRNPSPNFINISNKFKVADAEVKTYHEMLQEITNWAIADSEECKMPQHICRKCIKQLKGAYGFVIQIYDTYDCYRTRTQGQDDEIKDFEQLKEGIIEIPEIKTNRLLDFQLEVKENNYNFVEEPKEADIFLDAPEELDAEVKEEYKDENCLDEGEPDEMELESLNNNGKTDLNKHIACRCDVCHKIYRDNRSLTIHKRFTHMPEEEKMSCPSCTFKTSRFSALKAHVGLIHGPHFVEKHFKVPLKKFPCNRCEKGYQRRDDLRKHFREKHKHTPHWKRNQRAKRNSQNQRMREPDEMFSIDSDEGYEIESPNDDGKSDLNKHIACRCDVCHKIYRDERSLAIHKRFTHMPEEEKMPCPLCNYKTSRSSALKVHMGQIHGPDIVDEHFKPNPVTGKKFPCNQCERGYQRREDLRKHIRKKHKQVQMDKQSKRKEKPPKPKGEMRFLCACCGQSYTSKKALDGHQLTHTGERPHECDICQKSFKRIKDMKAHRVIHSDEKPFQCSQCTKSFKRADKLKMHMRVHSELRPYKCTECEKSFKYPCVLRTHMYMHTGQTPFSCHTCGEAFSLRTSLNNHCLKHGHVK